MKYITKFGIGAGIVLSAMGYLEYHLITHGLETCNEIIKRNYESAGGYDIKLSEMPAVPPFENSLLPRQVTFAIGNMKKGSKAFEYPVIVASDYDGDGLVDYFNIYKHDRCDAVDDKLKNLASSEQLNRIERELLKEIK